MNFPGFNASTKTIVVTTTQTVTFNPTEIPSSPIDGPWINEWYIETTGVNNSLDSAVTRVRVKANSQTILDMPSAHLRVLTEALAPSNTIQAAGRLSWTIPHSFKGRYTRDEYISSFPIGAAPQVEVDLGATSSAGTALIGWNLTKQQPTFWMKALSKNTNVPATTSPGRISVDATPGELLYAIVLPLISATGILTARVVINNEQVFFLDRAMILESEFSKNPSTVTVNFLIRFDEPVLIQGLSYVEVTTGAGSAATDQITFVTLVPQPVVRGR